MSTWLRQHWQTFGLTLARLAGNPLGTLLNVMVIGVGLKTLMVSWIGCGVQVSKVQ